MSAVLNPLTAPQSASHTPKGFQATLIDALCLALAESPRPPCLLRSPTGSGKTFMLTRTLQAVSARADVLWLWFVPFVTLVAQTVDTLDAQAADTGLLAKQLSAGQHETPEAGQVLVSTVQGVSSAKSRKAGYDDKADDDRRSLSQFLGLARSRGLEIGLVVDEAHIALANGTEFGHFVKWLKADYLLMASATPKDARINEFIAGAGNIAFKAFSVSRHDVIAERLNKPWLETVVYPMGEGLQGLTDLKLTVLRRAWRRNQHIGQLLRMRGLRTVPLLLVQVANGDEAIKEAQAFLMNELGVQAHAIGLHSASDPDPVMMAAIAQDTTKEVLIFKQSAGTGFDAPRAFVLASTKPVNDEDFAMQFIGRVMRVPQELQQAFPVAHTAPAELDTAYVFLADAQAQTGFADATRTTQAVESHLEGQIEALHAYRTALGGHGLTNRPTDEPPLAWDFAGLPTLGESGRVNPVAPAPPPSPPPAPHDEVELGQTRPLPGMYEALDGQDELDSLAAASGNPPLRPRRIPANRTELMTALESEGLRAYPRRASIGPHVAPDGFVTEVKPVFDVLELDLQAVARSLPLPADVTRLATRAALNTLTEREVRTELFSAVSTEEQVQVITDRAVLMQLTQATLAELGLEEQDCNDLTTGLARRLLTEIETAHAYRTDAAPPTPALLRMQARDAACWVILKQLPELREALQAQWASRPRLAQAQRLPDALLMPAHRPLAASTKNLYGVMYPETEAVAQAAGQLAVSAQHLFRNEVYAFASDSAGRPVGEVVSLARLDATFEFNSQEQAFAMALDNAGFVAWWHRNPQKKPYSVALMRSDSRDMFYPDFIVCLHHEVDEAPLIRLVETKHDVKDASRKARHTNPAYGRVLFMTKDASRFKIVQEDGRLGDVVDLDSLTRLRQWMRDTHPGFDTP